MVLNFDDGVQEYDLNGKCTIRINPTDFAFVDKMFQTFTVMEKKDENWREKLSKTSKTEEILSIYREGSEMIRDAIDGILGDGVCKAVFGDVNALSFGANGIPIWMNLILAVMDTMDTAYAKAQKAANPAINKYLQKYHR